MESSLYSFLPFLIFGAAIVVIFGGAWYLSYRRKKDLEMMCLNSGFEFNAEASALAGLGAYSVSLTAASQYSDSSGFAAIGGNNPGAASGPDPYANDRNSASGAPSVGSYADDPIYKKNGFFSSLFSYSKSPLDQTGLEIFNAGHSRKASNLVLVPFKKGKLYFFDYRYTTGSGKHSTTHNFTLALMRTAAFMPDFYLRPENFFDKIADFIGFHDIDIPGYDEFSKKYYLKSSYPEGVTAFFNNERILSFQANPGWNVYARGNYIVLFRKQGNLSVKNYQTYIEEVKTLLNSPRVD